MHFSWRVARGALLVIAVLLSAGHPLEAQSTATQDGPALKSLAGVRLGASGEATFAQFAERYRLAHPAAAQTPVPERRDRFGMLLPEGPPMPTQAPLDAPTDLTVPCRSSEGPPHECVMKISETLGAAHVDVTTTNGHAEGGKSRLDAPVIVVSVDQPVDDTNNEAVHAFVGAAVARFGEPTIRIPKHRGPYRDDHLFANVLIGVAGGSMYYPPTVETKMYAEAAIWCVGGTASQCRTGTSDALERRLTLDFEGGNSFLELQDLAAMRRDLAAKRRAETSALRPQL